MNTEISEKAQIGVGLVINHPFGIIVNGEVVAGNNLVIRHQVTIGNNGIISGSPKIGDNVNIGVGAKLIGSIEIASNTIIGANAVVNKTFESSGLLIGVPSKFKKRRL